MNAPHTFLAALVLAIGMALGGWFIGQGFVAGRTADRYVTVKGVAEREVEADIALWPIRFVATDDDLDKAQTRVARDQRQIIQFLTQYGLPASAIEIQSIEVNDALANQFQSGPVRSRFVVSETLMVRSDDPKRIVEASQDVGELVEAGVILSSIGGPRSSATYLFTGLNRIKPEMIAEATENARQAAAQFANDSASTLGEIRRATQGLFQILPRDRAPGITQEGQLFKTVRVVSTIQYYLQN